MYTLSNYILDLIHAAGAEHLFGVPGDYNLKFLDYVMANKDVQWVGNANELNASYMADGYARQRGFAAFVTTFGVGELSAINGLAGSIAEHVPVLEIVGSPTTQVQAAQKLVHHTFGDGDFSRFENAHRALGIETAYLTKDNAVAEVNRIFKYMADTKKPAYINIPTDLVDMPVDEALRHNLDAVATSPTERDNAALSAKLVAALSNADARVVAIVGHEVNRLGLTSAVEKLVAANNLPVATLGLGKGAINEQLPQFIGTYNGQLSGSAVAKVVDDADLVLTLGVKLTDSVTGGFTQSFTPAKTIAINADSVNILGESYTENIDMRTLVNQLADSVINTVNDRTATAPALVDLATLQPTDAPLTQAFYDQAVMGMMQPSQTLVAEQGTSFFGLAEGVLPAKANFIGQPLWGSIGYTFPAMLGSQIADRHNRTILSIGEGSLLLTIQEFGVMFKNDINPIMFIIDNTGYTVERVIHGMDEAYNDVPQLEYASLPKVFANGKAYKYFEVGTEVALIDAIREAQQATTMPVIITVHMAHDDAPASLLKLGKIFEQQNQ